MINIPHSSSSCPAPICDSIPDLVPPPTLLRAGVGVDVVDNGQVHHQGHVGAGGVIPFLKKGGLGEFQSKN